MILYFLCAACFFAGGIFFLVSGLKARKKKTPASFWMARKVKKVTSVPAFNKAVSNLFIVFSIPYLAAGVCMIAALWVPVMFYTALLLIILTVFPGLFFLIRMYKNIVHTYHAELEEPKK